MTTLQPRPPYTDAELAALYPPQLQLQYVQVFLRHGERTPVSARFTNAGLPAFWPYCRAMRQMRSVILSDDDHRDDPAKPAGKFDVLEWKRRLERMGHLDTPVPAAGPKGELDDICDLGMLTDRGRETTLQLGRRLRNLYVDQLGFLPPSIDDSSFIYLRSTAIPRALESLQQTFHGLYPPGTRAPNFPPPEIVTRALPDETLFPNDSNCRRFAQLSRAFAARAAERHNGSEDMAFMTKRIGKWMPPTPDGKPGVVGVDSHPRLSGIMDSINATLAHGPETKLPSEFYDPRVRSTIDKVAVEEWYAGYKESQEYRTLGIGGLLGDIVARMVGTAEHSSSSSTPPPIRLGLSGCHDTTLAAALTSLGAFEGGNWPPFTSHIAVELFRHADAQKAQSEGASKTSWLPAVLGGSANSSIGRKHTTEFTDAEKRKLQGYYVRLRYNDRPMTIPACKKPGNHLEGDESFCTLEAFKSIVDKFTPTDWKRQCFSNLHAPAFPTQPEISGT